LLATAASHDAIRFPRRHMISIIGFSRPVKPLIVDCGGKPAARAAFEKHQHAWPNNAPSKRTPPDSPVACGGEPRRGVHGRRDQHRERDTRFSFTGWCLGEVSAGGVPGFRGQRRGPMGILASEKRGTSRVFRRPASLDFYSEVSRGERTDWRKRPPLSYQRSLVKRHHFNSSRKPSGEPLRVSRDAIIRVWGNGAVW